MDGPPNGPYGFLSRFARDCDLLYNGFQDRSQRGRQRMATKVLDRHIDITPGIAGGKPRIRGHRITVQNVAVWHERLGKSVDEIAAEYDLTFGQVYAALAYYFDHREEMDQSIEDGDAYAEALRHHATSKVQQRLHELEDNGANR
jgi:uncharacterized protein (DUF433 family)